MIPVFQKTINSKINCNGIGLHSGEKISMTLIPADCDTGIVFRRTDFPKGKQEIKAHYSNVTGTMLGTVISNKHEAKVSTIEHLMAAIWGCGIDNLYIDIDGAEVPIMDGSSEPFVFLIECAGIKTQEQPRKIIEILKKVRVEDGDKFVEIEPSKDFSIDLHIDFNHDHIKQQRFDFHTSFTSFKNDISRARTFCFKDEIDKMHEMNLAKGGSLDNAIVVDKKGIINDGGLRYNDEFVRHKTLDFIGDIYLAGHYIQGHFNAFKSGHSMNNKMLRELLADESAWRII